MEAWEKAFRDYIAPQFSRSSLAQLRDAIAWDDERLVQGTVCMSKECGHNDQAEAYYACPIGYMSMCEWRLAHNDDIQDAFGDVCRRVDNESGSLVASDSFMQFVDQNSLVVVKAKLLRVLNDILAHTNQEATTNG